MKSKPRLTDQDRKQLGLAVFGRIGERLSEALALLHGDRSANSFPKWVQRVMRNLKAQLVPESFVSALSEDHEAFLDGMSTGLMSLSHELLSGGQVEPSLIEGSLRTAAAFTKQAAPTTEEFSRTVSAQGITPPGEVTALISQRLFSGPRKSRVVFAKGIVEGLCAIERLVEKRDSAATDATWLYFVLWLYWPDVEKEDSLSAVFDWLLCLYQGREIELGNFERFRKAANRIGLSFQRKQKRKSSRRMQ